MTQCFKPHILHFLKLQFTSRFKHFIAKYSKEKIFNCKMVLEQNNFYDLIQSEMTYGWKQGVQSSKPKRLYFC